MQDQERPELVAVSRKLMEEIAAHLRRWGAEALLKKILSEVVKAQ